jgi:hypothetical protein
MNKAIIPSTILLTVLIAIPSIMLLLGPAEQQTTPIQQTGPLKAKIEIPLKAGYTLTVRGPDGSIKQTYSDVPHSPTENFNKLLVLYYSEGRKKMFDLIPEYSRPTWVSLPTSINTCINPSTPPSEVAFRGMVVTTFRRYDGGPTYQKQLYPHTTRIYVGDQYVDGSSRFCATRAYGADASVSIGWNATHAWLIVSASIPVMSTTTVSNITWVVRLDSSVAQIAAGEIQCPYAAGPIGRCGTGAYSNLGPIYWIVWNDVLSPPINVSSGDTIDVNYVFYSPVPMSVNLVSILASILQTAPAPGTTLTNLIDTSGNVYVNHLPAVGAPGFDPVGVEIFISATDMVSALVWPALYIGWGTGVPAVTSPVSPPNLVNQVGEHEASMSISTNRLSFTGVISNPTGSPITVTEIAFMVGDSTTLRSNPTTWYYITSICPYDMVLQPNQLTTCGKRLVLVYLPISPGLTVPPGRAYKVELDLVFTPLP